MRFSVVLGVVLSLTLNAVALPVPDEQVGVEPIATVVPTTKTLPAKVVPETTIVPEAPAAPAPKALPEVAEAPEAPAAPAPKALPEAGEAPEAPAAPAPKALPEAVEVDADLEAEEDSADEVEAPATPAPKALPEAAAAPEAPAAPEPPETSESVGEGHPDKLCDQISDAILDACLALDPNAHVACETFATTNFVLIGGEMCLVKKNLDLLTGEVKRSKVKEHQVVIGSAGYDLESS